MRKLLHNLMETAITLIIDIPLHFGVVTGKLRDNLQQFLNIDAIFTKNVQTRFQTINGILQP